MLSAIKRGEDTIQLNLIILFHCKKVQGIDISTLTKSQFLQLGKSGIAVCHQIESAYQMFSVPPLFRLENTCRQSYGGDMALKHLGYCILAGLVVAGLIIVLNDPDSPLRLRKPEAQSVTVKEKGAPVAATSRHLLHVTEPKGAQENDKNEDKHSINIDAFEYFDEEGVTAEAANEYRSVNVIPYNPLVTVCEDDWVTLETQTGRTHTKKCTHTHKYETHPYYQFDAEVLGSLANQHGDALAAAVAADKLADIDAGQAMGLAVFASLISDKPGPIFNHAKKHFDLKYVADPLERARRIPTYYALMSRALEMGHPDVDLSFADSVPYELRQEWAESARVAHDRLKMSAVVDGYVTNYDD